MGELIAYYQSQINVYSIDLKRVKFKRNIVTSLKLISFGLIVYMLYLLISVEFHYSLHTIGAMIVSLIILSIIDSKIVTRMHILRELISLLTNEISYLNGDLSSFRKGEEYISAAHPYTFDLDIFGEESLYQSINRTVTSGGSDLLAAYLSTPCLNVEEIKNRQQSAQDLKNHLDWCHGFRATGTVHKTTISDNKIIEKWQKVAPFLKSKYLTYSIYFVNFLTITSWILAMCDLLPYNIPRILSLFQLVVSLLLTGRINKQHNSLNGFIKAIGNYFYLVQMVNNEPFESTKLNGLKEKLSGMNGALHAFKSLNAILSKLDQRSNILVTILLDSLYMKNVHHTIELDRWKSKYAHNISTWIESVNEIDVLISMSTYSFNHPDFSIPKPDLSAIVRGSEMCHPLLRSRNKVTNDFEIRSLHDIFIITGANMAGKSTFLRSIGVNFILASSGNVVCSSDFSFTPMNLFTSMRTTDNLSKGTSYFHAELLRLKSLIDMAISSGPIFIILDEMLKGTNSADKLNGSIKFLQRLLSLPLSGLVATHDLALGDLSTTTPSHFHNVCFEITHLGDEIIYDYKLNTGVSKNMNASILLEQMGLI